MAKFSLYLALGELVPDEIMIALIREKLSGPECGQGWILDGFPRTAAQATQVRPSQLQYIHSH